MSARAFLAASLLTPLLACAQWERQDMPDKMSGKSILAAAVESTDTLDLPAPYSGPNKARLVIRKHPTAGTDVIFAIQKGQMLCYGPDGCAIVVKFDDAKPMKFVGRGPSDRDPKIAFLTDPKRFIAAAKTAKTILVQTTYYHGGSPVLTFNTGAGLNW